jgi:hypothetical protein
MFINVDNRKEQSSTAMAMALFVLATPPLCNLSLPSHQHLLGLHPRLGLVLLVCVVRPVVFIHYPHSNPHPSQMGRVWVENYYPLKKWVGWV